jgi:hypothetical protein
MENHERSGGALHPVALGGALAAALASTLCCLAPYVFVSVGIAGPWLARFRLFDPVRIPLEVASLLALAAAWTLHARSRRWTARCADRPFAPLFSASTGFTCLLSDDNVTKRGLLAATSDAGYPSRLIVIATHEAAK